MAKHVDHLWRLLMTGLSFFSFGFVGLLVSLTWFPLIYLLPGGHARRQQRCRFAVHKLFAGFVGFMRWAGVLTFAVTGEQALREARGKLVIANHPSLIDVVLLIATMPRANCVVKQSLWRNPCIRLIVQSCGYIANGREPEAVLADCRNSLAAGDNLIIFPEGTRTTPGQSLKMQRGAANIALRCQADVLPVTIFVSPTTLTKAESWYQIPCSRPHFALQVGHPICLGQIASDQACESRNARIVTRYFKHYFQEELGIL